MVEHAPEKRGQLNAAATEQLTTINTNHTNKTEQRAIDAREGYAPRHEQQAIRMFWSAVRFVRFV
jgi:hypothetical protein